MTESPDVPWARPDDEHGPPGRFASPPSTAAQGFLGFLGEHGIRSGVILGLGSSSARDSVYFAQSGFHAHAMDPSPMERIARHGVRTYSADPMEYWLFEDGSFDLIMDFLCYCKEPDPKRRETYRGQLMRVLKGSGYFLLSVPDSFGMERAISEFRGLEPVLVRESDEAEGRTLMLILKRSG